MKRVRSLACLLLLLRLATFGSAQSVVPTVNWMGDGPVPDGMPAELPFAAKEFGAYHTKDPGYAIIRCDVAADGKTTRQDIRASSPELLKLIDRARAGRTMAPAKRHGQPIDSRFRITLIWSSMVTGETIPARIVAITKAWVDGAPAKAFSESSQGVPATIHLSDQGEVTEVDCPDTPSAVAGKVRDAVSHWVFSPALRGGRSVSSKLRLTILPEVDAKVPAIEITPPRLIKMVAPVYPNRLARTLIRGVVTVGFTVDAGGNVINPTSQSATLPGFEANALAAILQWKFRPAEKDGHPVASPLAVPVIFDAGKNGRDQYSIGGGDPKQLGYDTSPRIIVAAEPDYPYALLVAGVEGNAAVHLGINAEGRVVAVTAAATKPEFGLALLAAAQTYRFAPAQLKGKPVPCVLQLQQEFSMTIPTAWAPDISAQDDRTFSQSLAAHPNWLVDGRKLDHPLHPILQREATFPPNLVGKTAEGTADVFLIVDPQGRARLPRFLKASDPLFGYAAVQAAQFWRFDPPTTGGQPTSTSTVLPFHFTPPKL